MGPTGQQFSNDWCQKTSFFFVCLLSPALRDKSLVKYNKDELWEGGLHF